MPTFAEQRLAGRTREVVVLRVLGAVTAALLAIDAYVHFSNAGLYDFAAGGSVTQGTLFRVEGVFASVVAIALLVQPHWLVWVLAVLVSASAAGAVYLYTYVDVGALGPLPEMYEPTWALPGKRLSAVAESAGTVLAVIGLVVAVRARHARRPHARAK